MNTATYKPRIVASPYQNQMTKKHPFDISSKEHPVHLEILRHVKKIDLSIEFCVDNETINLLKIPGLVAFICKISQNGKVVALGRSNGLISENSRYFDNIIKSCRDYSLVDGISKLVRATDTLRANTSKPAYDYSKEAMLDDAIIKRDSQGVEMITEKQKGYLRELIQLNVMSETERTRLESQMSEYTKSEASKMIQGFQK